MGGRPRQRNPSFWETSVFRYKHGFRICRIWDESFLPNKPHTVTVNDLYKLLAALSGRAPEPFCKAVHDIVSAINDTEHQSIYEVPHLYADYGTTFDDLTSYLKKVPKNIGGSQSELATLEALEVMSGALVAIRKSDNRKGGGKSALTYEPVIPSDFAPIVVADASGVHRRTYSDLEQDRKLVRLEPCRKDCSNLIVHWFNKGGGKASWAADFEGMIALVVDIVAEEPSRRQLVIHHKAKTDGPIKSRFPCPKEAILKRLEEMHPDYDTDLLSWLTWGKHRATNEFRDIPVVTLAGTLFKGDAVYEATLRAARSYLPEKGAVEDHDLRLFRKGELLDDLCQAAGRGTLRQNDQHQPWKCPAGSRINLILSSRNGITGDELDQLWLNHRRKFRKTRRDNKPGSLFYEVMEYLEKCAKRQYSPTFSKMRKDLRWKERGIPVMRLRDTVRSDPRYLDYITQLGFEEAAGAGKTRISRWHYVGTFEQYGFVEAAE